VTATFTRNGLFHADCELCVWAEQDANNQLFRMLLMQIIISAVVAK
jgi:hypothetical protein